MHACGIIASMSGQSGRFCFALAGLLMAGAAGFAQDAAADLLRQGRQKLSEGKPEEALAIYRQAVAAVPDSVQANNQTGVVLDLMGQYGEARKYFAKAIDVAAT